MKKTFLLQVEGKNPDRILEAVKHEVRQYARREGRKTVPPGFDYWDFDCKVGLNAQDSEAGTFAQVVPLIDAVAKTGAAACYVEVLSKPVIRARKPQVPEDEATESNHMPSNEASLSATPRSL
jgi:hypothetical protein